MRKPWARIFAMNDLGVTSGGPDGRRLLALGLQEAVLILPYALAAPIADGLAGAASAAATLSTSAAVASTRDSPRSQGLPSRDRRAFTGTPRADGSVPMRSLPPLPAMPRSFLSPGR